MLDAPRYPKVLLDEHVLTSHVVEMLLYRTRINHAPLLGNLACGDAVDADTSSSPVGGAPSNPTRQTPMCLNLVTTVPPSATCCSMVKLVVQKSARICATERLRSSRVGPCPGIRLRSTKSGATSSSMTSRFPLASVSSKKRRAMALFSCASDDTAELAPHQANLWFSPTGWQQHP